MGPEPEVNLGSQYYEEGRYQEAADYYQEKVDEVFQTASGMNRPTVRSILTWVWHTINWKTMTRPFSI